MVPDFLQRKIKSAPDFKISYAAYMSEVLYHPKYGYYMKDRQKVGARGDFLTSSNVHNIYGKLFARLMVDYFKQSALPPAICEIGGGNGRFAKQLLEEVKLLDGELFENLTYIMVESSPYHLECQKEAMPKDAAVVFYSSLEEIPEVRFEGIIFSNELFDALPVHVIENREGLLSEVFVTLTENGSLKETHSPLVNQAIFAYLKQFNLILKEGQRVEVPIAMMEFSKRLSSLLTKGLLITVDYGYKFSDLAMEEHRKGSLRGYFHHQLVENPLKHPGEMDLTAHIHLEALCHSLKKEGLIHVCSQRQGEFLVRAGILDYLQENMDSNPFSEKSRQNRAIRSLIMYGSWSNSFHVMIHEKNTNVWNDVFSSEK